MRWCRVYTRSFFFFFSSRRRHTRSDRDWSSDVCSSDLHGDPDLLVAMNPATWTNDLKIVHSGGAVVHEEAYSTAGARDDRSEERRVGKECRSRWSPYH